MTNRPQIDKQKVMIALTIITDKLRKAKKNPVVLSWDDAGEIKLVLEAIIGDDK